MAVSSGQAFPLTLNVRGLTKHLRVSRRTIERMRAAGTFPRPLPGFRRPRWSTAVVLRWLRTNGSEAMSTNNEGECHD